LQANISAQFGQICLEGGDKNPPQFRFISNHQRWATAPLALVYIRAAVCVWYCASIVSKDSLLERLSAHRTLAAIPQEQIAWVAAHGVFRELETGGVLTSMNGQVEGLHVVLSGYLSIHVDRGAGPRKIMEWRGGDVTGLMPYSRLVAPPGDVVAQEPTEVVTVDRKDFPEMIRDCYELTAALVHVMLDRARHFTSSYLHDEKLVSLGKLAAGLAHELNNPASAIARSAGTLPETLIEAEAAARSIGAIGLKAPDIAPAEKIRAACLAAPPSSLSPLDREGREDSIYRWLASHKVETSLAEELADMDVTLAMLDELARSLDGKDGQALDVALRWIASGCKVRRLASEIHEAASRIHDLVGAIKGFTEMDRVTVPEPVQLERGLASTLVVLRSKAKSKSVHLTLNVDKDLPSVYGFGGELNQVWANLIDNAIDAVSEGGRIEVIASHVGNKVVVCVIDNGPGVPAAIRDRIFDPFFSTKPAGQGTGIGLDIVRRLIVRHNGVVELHSDPVRTEFRVTLPAAETC
jgi:signal transduction histidine kinase